MQDDPKNLEIFETLAGRVEFIDMSGFNMDEVGTGNLERLWCRGSLPRSYLAKSEDNSVAWRRNFVRSFLERDIPRLGNQIPAATLRRFWTMIAHYHGQNWNASEIARSFGVSDKTVTGYLDIFAGTFMVRQLTPWFENVKKRQVRAPRVYLRDSGLVHTLLGLEDHEQILAHPKCGASWEGFALEQVLRRTGAAEHYFWGTHGGGELDLLLFKQGRRIGVEFKRSETPKVTRSMRTAIGDLGLEHLWVVYPGEHLFPLDENVTVTALGELPATVEGLSGTGKSGSI